MENYFSECQSLQQRFIHVCQMFDQLLERMSTMFFFLFIFCIHSPFMSMLLQCTTKKSRVQLKQTRQFVCAEANDAFISKTYELFIENPFPEHRLRYRILYCMHTSHSFIHPIDYDFQLYFFLYYKIKLCEMIPFSTLPFLFTGQQISASLFSFAQGALDFHLTLKSTNSSIKTKHSCASTFH